MDFIVDIMQYSFLQKALFTAVMVGTICGLLGCFIVLRGLALMGDAISHAVLPGVALSFMMNISFFYGAVAAGVLTALGVGYVNQNSRIKSDSSIGIIFTVFLAVVVLLILIFYKEFLVSTFDPTMAAAYGLPTNLIHYTLMVLLTLVTVASMQTVGVILVVALLITPASTAYLLTNRLGIMLLLSSLFGIVDSLFGLYFSFEYDLESGAVIVITSFIMFALVFFLAPKQGVLWKKIRARRKQTAATE